MTPFTFGGVDVATEWARFTSEAAKWKPDGYDTEMALRLRYYLDQQLADTKAELARRFPETHEKMVPVTLPITRHLIREQAKVFLATTKLDLVQDGEPLAGEDVRGDEGDDDEGTITPSPLVDWWEKTKERMGLALRLKRVDAYTQLMRTCGLRVQHIPGQRFAAHVVFPHQIRAVMNRAAPMDLDQAHGVAVEIASESGHKGGARRWEFWCARKGEEQHVVVEESKDAEGKLRAEVADTDGGDPLVAPDGRTVVPLVMFTAHTEELGLFTMEGSDLVPMNRGLNVLVSDIHNIAEQQGFGVLVVTTQAGGKTPGKIVRSPNTAIALDEGVDAKFINANAPLADLIALVKTRLQMAATLHGIPPGSVALDARAVASGIALQIEMRPLTEARQDQVEVYRDPIRRFWEIFWAVFNAFVSEANAPVKALDPDLELRWTPGEIQVPTDESVRVENVVLKRKERLISRAEAIAEMRGVTVEEAKEIAQRIDDDEAVVEAEPLEEPVLAGLDEKRATLNAPKPVPGKGAAEAAALDGVVQDTALNGAQVQSLLEIAQAVADGSLPFETAQAMIEAAFPAMPEALVQQIINGLRKFEKKEPPAAPPSPFPPKQPLAPPPAE